MRVQANFKLLNTGPKQWSNNGPSVRSEPKYRKIFDLVLQLWISEDSFLFVQS